MPRWKRVTRSLCYSITDRLEVRIKDPRTRDSAKNLEPLIYHTADNAGDKDVVSLSFADAPIKENRYCKEEYLLTDMRNRGEEKVSDAGTYAFQKT
jgi:hypothetical protein